jgi:hypothetical protein
MTPFKLPRSLALLSAGAPASLLSPLAAHAQGVAPAAAAEKK